MKLSPLFQRSRRFVASRPLLSTLILGSAIMCAWALLRFFTYPSTFDLVGQQLLARQWTHGGMQGGVVGPTNYFLKMLFLYVPFDWLRLSPRLSLVLMTLLVTIGTFILVSLLMRAILRELGVAITAYFYLAMLWFACLAGSIFWVQFTNFRNLEFAGGLYLIYLGLHLRNHASWKLSFWMALFAGILFFADPLQLYMTALPLLLFITWQVWREKKPWSMAMRLALAIVGGAVLAKLVRLVVVHWTGLLFLQSGSSSQALHSVLQHPFAALKGWVACNIRLFAGGVDMGRWRQAVDIAVWIVLIAVGLRSWRRFPKPLATFLLIAAAIIELVYLSSGQSLQGDTSRYLIMLVPLGLLLLSALPRTRWLTGLLAAVIALTVLPLGIKLAANWDTSFSKDNHLAHTESYANTIPFEFAVTSMDTAIPATYYYRPSTPLLPVECNGNLHRQTLYYSGTAYDNALRHTSGFAAIILDGSAINTYPHTCDSNRVVAQFGQPTFLGRTGDGSLVLAYPASQLAQQLRR